MIPWDIESPAILETLTDVTAVSGGWYCTMGALGLFVPQERCLVPPQVGEVICTIGGLGQDVRAIQVGDRCYRYFTEAEMRFRQQQWYAYHEAQKQAEGVS